MTKPLEAILAGIAQELQTALGANLVSCCVYGSAVRGNAIEGVSDINLLVVVERSDGPAHEAIAQVLAAHPEVDPFVVSNQSLNRTAQCFATKFASIKRNYRVLVGADVLVQIGIDPQIERLVCEQTLRNLRLRLSYAFIMQGPGRKYDRFLAANISAIFIQLAEVLRLSGHEIPKDFGERIPLFAHAWAVDARILEELLALRQNARALSKEEVRDWHQRLLAVLDLAMGSVERNWGEFKPAAK